MQFTKMYMFLCRDFGVKSLGLQISFVVMSSVQKIAVGMQLNAPIDAYMTIVSKPVASS